jgi:hypothetical protein
MFQLTTSTGRSETIESLIAGYPDLYAADESGFEIDPQDLMDDPETVADAGYGYRETRRILFWKSEQDSENDPGQRSIAAAIWEDD